MQRVQLVTYQRKKIILADATQGCSPAEAVKVLAAMRDLVAKHPPGCALILTDVTGFVFDDLCTKEALFTTKANKPYVKASALVGIEGLKKIVVTALSVTSRRSFQCFRTRQEALHWLAQQ